MFLFRFTAQQILNVLCMPYYQKTFFVFISEFNFENSLFKYHFIIALEHNRKTIINDLLES